MNRRVGWTLLVATGLLSGSVLSFYRPTIAATPAPAAPFDAQMETINQLKEINAQLREINVLLRSGDVKAVVVMNPGVKP